MNRIDRLFAITLLLQRQRRVRAQDLAKTFEVSERTIYRDITALSESGVPVVALPGEGYELAEGFFLRPLLLSLDEARALFLGAQMLATTACHLALERSTTAAKWLRLQTSTSAPGRQSADPGAQNPELA